MTDTNILSALEEQVEWYQRLAKLAELQHEHVQQYQTEELLDVLRRRQEVLDQVGRLEEMIRPAKRQWSQYMTELDELQRTKAEMLLAQTRQLLEEITSADRNDALALQQRKLNLGKQINQAQSARQVNRTYAASAYGTRVARMDVSR